MIALLVLALLGGMTVFYVLISRQLRDIHTLVNSNLTKVQADLKVALQRIESLEAALVVSRDE